MLLEALKVFDSNKQKISEQMQKGLEISVDILGKCLKDGGDLIIRHSRAGKQFVACSKYPDCTVTYSLPQNAKIVASGKVCEYCKTPIVKVIRRGKGVFEIDLDPNCRTKDKWKAKQQVQASASQGNNAQGASAKMAPIAGAPKAAEKPRGDAAITVELKGKTPKAAQTRKQKPPKDKSALTKRKSKKESKV